MSQPPRPDGFYEAAFASEMESTLRAARQAWKRLEAARKRLESIYGEPVALQRDPPAFVTPHSHSTFLLETR